MERISHLEAHVVNGNERAGSHFVRVGDRVQVRSRECFASVARAIVVDWPVVLGKHFFLELQLSVVNESASESLKSRKNLENVFLGNLRLDKKAYSSARWKHAVKEITAERRAYHQINGKSEINIEEQ